MNEPKLDLTKILECVERFSALESHLDTLQSQIKSLQHYADLCYHDMTRALEALADGLKIDSVAAFNNIDLILGRNASADNDKSSDGPVAYAKQFRVELKTHDKHLVNDDIGLYFAITRDKGSTQIELRLKKNSWGEKHKEFLHEIFKNVYEKLDSGDEAVTIIKYAESMLSDDISEEVLTRKMIEDFINYYNNNRVTIHDTGFSLETSLKDDLEKHMEDVNKELTDYVTQKIGYNTCAKNISKIVPCSIKDARRLMYCIL